jgi:rRNA maturation RNase YbeY
MKKNLVKRAVTLKCEAPSARRYVRAVSADARALLKLLSLDNYELSLLLTGDSRMRELNRAFRGRDSSTDVLSFPQFDNCAIAGREHSAADCEIMPAALGDVVISVDTALRQAERLGVTSESRLRTLLIHGVLHLLGYDHEKSRADARRMFARERELAAALASAKKGFSRSSFAASLLETAEHP